MLSFVETIKEGGRKGRLIVVVAGIGLLIAVIYQLATRLNLNTAYSVGEIIDSLHGVEVYYNGGVNNVEERNTSEDGYNLGLRYQCVEFVKRYYYERFGHRMPDTFGHARDFFDLTVQHGSVNTKRGLLQFHNQGNTPPNIGDIVVYSPSLFNPYGHVAIVSMVDIENATLEIIQQNAGPFSPSRERYPLIFMPPGQWYVENNRILGWLRKE
ncbi:CHAP domain-containing protein [Microbulbifer sp. PAAF003]|uniref:CHAP domain-containing protein n=1 Tax=unclassified Microbulbifer TaxID=2619833 RepID=UPI00403A33A8